MTGFFTTCAQPANRGGSRRQDGNLDSERASSHLLLDGLLLNGLLLNGLHLNGLLLNGFLLNGFPLKTFEILLKINRLSSKTNGVPFKKMDVF